MDELNLLRLSNVRKNRDEIKKLKLSKKKLFDINRFSLNEQLQAQYTRNINICNKLLRLESKRYFHLYINNIKSKKIEIHYYDKLYLKHLCNRYNISHDIFRLILKYL